MFKSAILEDNICIICTRYKNVNMNTAQFIEHRPIYLKDNAIIYIRKISVLGKMYFSLQFQVYCLQGSFSILVPG